MSIADFLQIVVQVSFIYLTIATGIDYLRHGHTSRLHIFLMFGSLGLTIIIQLVTAAFKIESRWFSLIGTTALLAHPYLLLRLVQQFRSLPRRSVQGCLAGLLLSVVTLVIFNPLPTVVTLLLIVYFGGFEIYAAAAFIRGAVRSAGVTHRRLRMAALGSGLLGASFLALAVFALLFPGSELLTVLLWVGVLASAIAYYAAFATPGWLRRFWQSQELYGFLRNAMEIVAAGSNRETLLAQLESAAANTVGGSSSATALWADHEKTILTSLGVNPQLRNCIDRWLNETQVINPSAARTQVTYRAESRTLEAGQVFDATDSEIAYIVPIRNVWIDVGFLLIFLRRESLFVQEDLEYLGLIAQQSALVLENQRLIDELHAANEQLEDKVQARTAQLRESEERFRTIAETIPLPLTISRFSDRMVMYANQHMAEFHKMPLEQIIGNQLPNAFHDPADRELIAERLAQQGYVHGMELRLKPLFAEEVVWCKIWIEPIDFLGEQLILSTFFDVTERREAVEALHILNAELEERVEARTAQLAATNRELEAFTYTVSHDLRAPLRAMSGFSRQLQQKYAPDLPEQAQHYLARIQHNAEHMGNLIDDLLTLSRLGRKPLDVQYVNLRGLVEEILKELDVEDQYPDATIQLDELPSHEVDPTLIKQAYLNFITNALKFSRKKEAPYIHIGCERREGEAVYFVKDNGVGFDMQYANKLFGVFERLHSSRDYEGTGVGLATVQRVIHRHGGRVWADAALDHGATFYFTLGREVEYAR